MLTLLLGRAGSGKSTRIMEDIRRNGASRPQILLVPEQASHETERRLCETNGNGVSRYAEVFSFTSLWHRVLSREGGLAQASLDEGGRVLVMYAALRSLEGSLSVLGTVSRRPEFLSSLLSAVDELKSCCITPEHLRETAALTEGLGEQKLQDLALIYDMYNALTSRGSADPRDQLTRLTEKLHTSAFGRGVDLYIDGFTDFTPQEALVIEALLPRVNTLTVALTCDALQEEDGVAELFAPARHTAQHLRRMAREHHVPDRVEMITPGQPCDETPRTHLERTLFSREPLPYGGDPQGKVLVFRGKGRREEVAWTAGKIRELVQEGVLRYRDIAVTARSMTGYHNLVESIFEQYRIPVFQSAMEDIMQKPVFSLVMAAQELLEGEYRYETVFRYLKTGLTNISLADCDTLENYVLLWKIRGNQWRKENGFTLHPRGYQKDMEEGDVLALRRINEIRCKVISPFEKARENQDKTVKGQVLCLYQLLEEISLTDTLEARRKALLDLGEPELAQEYGQLWERFCTGLDQCVDILGELAMEPEEFTRLLSLLFSRYHVGSIPASLDRVVVGEAARLANRRVKAVFFLGADDASIPQLSAEQGLLTEEDRELLAEYGMPVSPGAEERYSRELTLVYTACTQPEDYLFVTWPESGEGSGENQPSFLVERLEAMFPGGVQAEDTDKTLGNNPSRLRLLALEDGVLRERMREDAATRDWLHRMEEAALWKRGGLSGETVAALYGKKIAMSASRLDRYKSCHFAYYLQYGLRARPRKAAAFDAPEYGTFVHFVLEYVLRAVKERGGISQVPEEAVQALTGSAVQEYSRIYLGGLEQQSPRFRYLFLRLKHTVTLVVNNVTEELRSSAFQPVFFELGFGREKDLPPVELEVDGIRLSISGFVDRVDGWEEGGKMYLRVIDYKTGQKSFDFTEIWHGLGLQMLLYLFALEDGSSLLGADEVVPAGVLYLPAREAVISGSRDMTQAERRRLVDKELTRKGLILDEPAVIQAMETDTGAGLRFLPLRVSAKTGEIRGSALVSAQRLGRLKQHVEQILSEICLELKSGKINADPFWRGPNRNACLYCEYAAACHFEECLGEDRRRWIPSVSNEEFWTNLEEQEEGGAKDGAAANP